MALRRIVVTTVAAALATACSSVDTQQQARELERLTAATPSWVDDGALGRRLWAIEQTFYDQREYEPAWIDGDDPTRQLDALLEALREADRHGLDPAAYDYEELAAERAKADEPWLGTAFDAARVPELDLRLTYAFLAHAADLLGWRRSPREIDSNWLASPKKVDLAERLRAALDDDAVRETLGELAPAHSQYRGLQEALARYRGDGQDGDEADRIRMNLERWRWAPRDLGERHILINIPVYQMQVIENDEPVLAMRVIVGAPETPTPIFSDEMTYVVFSPYWNIPESILREETLPRVVEDPEYLARNRIEVVGTSGEPIDPEGLDWEDPAATEGLRFRQAPGPENALGLVKFIFPNHFSVYLHDTPTQALFDKPNRTFSHGCIRIEQPVALAHYVLRGRAEWTEERIAAAMRGKKEQAIKLEEALPVHIGYWTAWVEEDGSVTFTDDPYGLDRKHTRASGL